MSGQSPMPHGPLVVVAEHAEGRLAPPTLEVVACARAVAHAFGGEIKILLLGSSVQAAAEEALRLTGEEVVALEVPRLTQFHGEALRLLLPPLLKEWQARAVLTGHTTSGLDWLPGLAARLDAACVTGVEDVRQDGHSLTLSRSTFFGKALEEVAPHDWPLAITVQPGAFPAAAPRQSPSRQIQVLRLEPPELRARVLQAPPGEAPDQALGQARVVVAAGRGVGKPENLGPLRDLAACFSGAALAGSRPVCDMGWLGYQSQVGLTGATVSPRLYIACGISGARQHTVGMQGSGFIVAINSDARAAIFQIADVSIVEDLTVFISALLECLRG